MKNEDKATLVGAATALTLSGVVGLWYLHVVRTERKKRERIKTWQQENLACIENSNARLMELIKDPNTSLADLFAAIDEEAKFRAIVRNQPMY